MKKIKNKNNTNPLPIHQRGMFNGVLKSILFLLLLSKADGLLFAQQLPFSSQYYTDQFVINPAFTGTSENVNAFLTHRSQWTGIAGAPQTSYLTLDGPTPTKNVGLGLKVYSDVTDMISRTGAFANYSYKLKIDNDNTLYFGLAMGVIDTKIDFSKSVILDKDDPLLFQQPQNKTVFSADFGVVYMWQKLTVGFAIPQILGNSVQYAFPNGQNSYYNLDRHYQGTVKYEFDVIKEKGITAYPLLMVRSVSGAPFQYDINGVIDWKKIGWAAITYHSNYALAISAGVRYQNFSLGYSYDVGVSKIRSYTGSSSEFLLGYVFGERKKGYVRAEEPVIDTLKNLAKAKADSANMAMIAQIKATSDTNRIEINKLKTTLAAAKTPEKPTPLISDSLHNTGGNEALMGQMKKISDRYYEVVKQVDDGLNAQMKVVSDTNQAQIDRLKARLAALETAKASSTAQVTTAQAASEATKTLDNLIHSTSSTEKVNAPSKTNTTATGGVIKTSESDDYADETGKAATTGFYVVIGTFGNKDNVEKFKAANIVKGHVNTKVVQNNFTKVYRVYVLKTNNRADADAERAKYKAEYPDVWILKLE